MAFGAMFRTFAILASVHTASAAYETTQTAPQSAHHQRHKDLMRRKVVNVARPGERAKHVVVEYRQGSAAETAMHHLTQEQTRFAARWPGFFSNLWNNVKKAATKVVHKISNSAQHMAKKAAAQLKAQVAVIGKTISTTATAAVAAAKSGNFSGALELTKAGLAKTVEASKKAAATIAGELKGDLTKIQREALEESHKAASALAKEHGDLLKKLQKGQIPAKEALDKFLTIAKAKQVAATNKVEKLGEAKVKALEATAKKEIHKQEESSKALETGAGR